MASLTTLFVVGPEEYVEFSESMGSKAFLEHIWDQEKTPLKIEETSAFGTQLHSAGARLSPTPPPRIEFPTVLRVRGRGNKYRLSGKYISWEELKKRNPSAVKDPPSLEEFVSRGATVGTAERLEPGSFLKDDKRFKIKKKPQVAGMSLQKDNDGWIGEGGASDSVYANKGSLDSIYAVKPATEDNLSPKEDGRTSFKPDALRPEPVLQQPKTLRKSRSGLSLFERLGMDKSKEETPALPPTGIATDKEVGNVPLPSRGPALAPHLQPPLSASCTPPETPLKGPKATLREPVMTPTEASIPKAMTDLPLAKSGLQLEAAPASTSRSVPSSTSRAARSQIDDMLLKVRQARTTISSGGGSSESMWAPKQEELKTVEVKGTTKLAVPDATPSAPKSTVRRSNVKDNVHSGERPQDKVIPSLLSRLGPPTSIADEPSTANAKPSSGTSEKKIHQPSHPTSANTSSNRNAEGHKTTESYQRASVESKPSEASAKAEVNENMSQDAAKHGKDQHLQHTIPASAPSSSSLSSSLPSERKSEDLQTSADSKSAGVDAWSTVGNDTVTSIDWADLDDDDDSPLDVPEDWGYGDLDVFSDSASQKPTDPINVAQSNNDTQKHIAASADPPRQPRGMRIGQTWRPSDEGGKTSTKTSSLPYWQKRSAFPGSTSSNEQRSTSKEIGSLKIAGAAAANAHSKGGKKKNDPSHCHEQPKKELFPQHQGRRESNTSSNAHHKQQPPHRGKQPMVLPPNATPIQPVTASASSKPPQDRSRPSATRSEGAFARLTKDVIGVGAKEDPSARSKDLASRINLSSGIVPPSSTTKESKKKSKGGARGGRRPSQA